MTEWRWLTPEDRAARNEHILEMWLLGYDPPEIAERYDITPVRVRQIINAFGKTRPDKPGVGALLERIAELERENDALREQLNARTA